MKNIVLFLALVFLTASLSGCATGPGMEEASPPANPTPERLSQGQMPAYCRGEASAEFGQSP